MKKSIEIIVGIFAILGVVALLFLALRVGNLSSFSFNKEYSVTAQFDNVGSLKPRAAVKTNGVVVGRVDDIQFDNKHYKAVVKLDLESKYHFPSDTSASIKTEGLLGEQFVDLTPGAEETDLKENDTIMFTQSAIVIEDLISKFLFSTAEKQGTEENK